MTSLLSPPPEVVELQVGKFGDTSYDEAKRPLPHGVSKIASGCYRRFG
jgi:hypothetical protein